MIFLISQRNWKVTWKIYGVAIFRKGEFLVYYIYSRFTGFKSRNVEFTIPYFALVTKVVSFSYSKLLLYMNQDNPLNCHSFSPTAGPVTHLNFFPLLRLRYIQVRTVPPRPNGWLKQSKFRLNNIRAYWFGVSRVHCERIQ